MTAVPHSATNPARVGEILLSFPAFLGESSSSHTTQVWYFDVDEKTTSTRAEQVLKSFIETKVKKIKVVINELPKAPSVSPTRTLDFLMQSQRQQQKKDSIFDITFHQMETSSLFLMK